jgi:hypothetical protein
MRFANATQLFENRWLLPRAGALRSGYVAAGGRPERRLRVSRELNPIGGQRPLPVLPSELGACLPNPPRWRQPSGALAIAELKLCRSAWNDSRETLRPNFPSFLRATPSSMPARTISLLNAMLSPDFPAPCLGASQHEGSIPFTDPSCS